MAETRIEWADRCWNPITGCSPVSAGCEHCYAARMAKRLAGRNGYPKDDPFKVTVHMDKLETPLHWRRRGRIFVNSMSDLFHPDVPDEIIQQLFTTMAVSNGTFLILTKRPQRMKELLNDSGFKDGATYVESDYGEGYLPWPLPNVWLGVTIEDQSQENRIRYLLDTPAVRRFISYEPALGPLNIEPYLTCPACGDSGFSRPGTGYDAVCDRCGGQSAGYPKLDWVIAGGETGPGARPAHPDWFRQLRDQCASAGVPFFFKSFGEWAPLPELFRYEPAIGSDHRQYHAALRAFARKHGASILIDDRPEGWDRMMIEDGTCVIDGQRAIGRVGKKAAGRLLDGREHSEFPEEVDHEDHPDR